MKYLGKIGEVVGNMFSYFTSLADDAMQLERWRAIYGDGLEKRVKNYDQVVGEYEGLKKTNKGLSRRNDELRNQISIVKKAQEELSVRIEKCNATYDQILNVNDARRDANEGLERLRNNETLKKVQALKELELLRGSAYSLAIQATIEANPNLGEIPFVYYDIVNGRIISTPATYELLKITEDPENLSIKGILSYIRREERLPIIDKLKNKRDIKHLNAYTKGDDPKELKLSTYYFEYGRKPIGVGIFLDDPKKISLKGSPVKAFVEKIVSVTDIVRNQLEDISSYVRKSDVGSVSQKLEFI